MKRSFRLKAAGSSLMLALTMAGCSGVAYHDRVASASQAMETAPPLTAAAQVEAALAAHDGAKAVAAAEAAVAADPRNADYRALLGRAYLLDGRFVSAETSFGDAMALGNADPRTIVSLALMQAAQGRGGAAQSLLAEHRDILPAADYGLAITLAGDTEQGISVLTQAARGPESNSRTRQNLAYALALNGQWREAQLMASMDMDPAQVRKRIEFWAQSTQQGAEPQRVIAMLGVSPRTDAGLPAALALNAAVPAAGVAPVEMAAAPATPAEPAEIARFDEPVAHAPGEAAVAEQVAQPPVQAVEPVASARTEPVRERPVVHQAPAMASLDPANGSAYVVQLGAFESDAVARDGWRRMARANAALAAFPVVNGTVALNGKTFHRLAIAGFRDHRAASQMCQRVKARGGACFVRLDQGIEQRWAAARTRARSQQVAMR